LLRVKQTSGERWTTTRRFANTTAKGLAQGRRPC